MKALRPLAYLLALAATVAAAAGCGGSTLDPVAKAATKTSDLGSFRVAFTMNVTAGGGAFPLTGDGAWSASDRRMRMTMHSTLPIGSGAAPSALDMQMIMDLASTPVMYMSMPLLTKELPGHPKWIKLDLSAVAARQGIDLGQLLQSSSQLDPRQTLAMLTKAGKVSTVGAETVDGVKTTHYHVVVDAKKAVAAQTNAESRAAVTKLLDQAGIQSLPVDVWIGEDGYVHRYRMDMTMKTAAGEASMSMTETLKGFGTPVHVDLPPAGEVFDGTSLVSPKS